MNVFFLSLIIIFAAGVIPFLTLRWFSANRYIYSGLTTIGCITGLCSLVNSTAGSCQTEWSWTWLHSLTLTFSLDSLSSFFLLPVFLVCPLAAIYSFGYFDQQEKNLRNSVSFFFTNILILSMTLVIAAGNLITFALAWELMSLSSYFLVMYDYTKETTRKAGYLYFIFAQTGALFIFASFGIIFSHTGHLLFNGAATLPDQAKLLVFFLAFIGFASKAGVFPFHVWLPHAHPAAPSHISAIMSGVMIKMGIYGIFRMYFALGSTDLLVGQIILFFGMISAVLGVVYALGKHNLKRLLAYHSVENIGIILMGMGFGMIGIHHKNAIMTGFGFGGALLHVFNHSLFKSLLFFGAGNIIKETGTACIDEMGGLMKKMTITGKTFLTGSVSISGLPPFNGFVSEFLIYFSAFQGLQYDHSTLLSSILAIISLAVTGGLASFCFTKVVGIVFLGEPRTKAAAMAMERSRFMTLPMLIPAIGCLAIGIFPQFFINTVFAALVDLPGITAVDPELVDTVGANLALASRLFLLLLTSVILCRKLLYRKKDITRSSTWGCGFTRPSTRIQYTGTSYARSVIDFFRPFVLIHETTILLDKIFPGRIHYKNHMEDIVEAGLTKGFSEPLLTLLKKLRWIQHGNIQLYIGYIISTVLVLLLILFK